MYGQSNYASQFRHGPPTPPLPFQVAPSAGQQPPFQQASLTNNPPPPPLHGPQHQSANQVLQVPPPPPVYPHGPTPSSSIQHPPPVTVNISQPYVHVSPPAPSNYGSAHVAHSYSQQIQAGIPYPPQVGSQSVRHIPPLAFPPPSGLHPSGVSSHGQSLYRAPHPPPPGIQHVPAPPPPPPSGFVTVTPAPFTPFVHGSVNEAHPPSVPPPPPPLPPSSPPPPPSPPPPNTEGEELPILSSEEMQDDTIVKDQHTDKSIYEPSDATCSFGVSPVHSDDSAVDENAEAFANKEDSPIFSLPPPPRPADEVVLNIEALCKFMANVGADFENLARVKEVGNPHFTFLFGGEPGSTAAVGYEYFQWMKRKFRLNAGTGGHPRQIMSAQTQAEPRSSIEENKPSPSGSDMDMDDDAGQPEGGHGLTELIKGKHDETVDQCTLKEQINSHSTTTWESVHKMSVPRVSSSDKRNECHMSAAVTEHVQGRLTVQVQQDATSVDVFSPHSDGSNMEAPGVFVKDGSPFRHIQGYASDDSGDGNKKQSVTGEEVLSVTGHDPFLGNDEVESYSALDPKGTIDTEKSNQSCVPTLSHDVALAAPTLSDLIHGLTSVDSSKNYNEDDPTIYTGKDIYISSSNDFSKANKDNMGQKAVNVRQEKCIDLGQVDEFGRMIREGANSSDSEDVPIEHGRSNSRSPQQSRRRSRSPWKWRGRRSPSQSCSPRRQSRSRSPPPSRRMRARRSHAQPPECVHFLRGRCYRGASCWFLHSDSRWNRNKPHNRQDVSKNSVKYARTDIAHGTMNMTMETVDVGEKILHLEEDIQELEPEAKLHAVDANDEALAGRSSLDSIKDDAEHLSPHQIELTKDNKGVNEETASHQSPILLQDMQQAELKQATVDTQLREGEDAQKTLNISHSLPDANMDDQTSSASKGEHPLAEDNLGQPSDEVLTNHVEAHPPFPLPVPQPEHQSPQDVAPVPSVSQLSTHPVQSSAEIPVLESHPDSSIMDPSLPNQDPDLSHFVPQSSGFTGAAVNNNLSQTQAPFQGLPADLPPVNQTQGQSFHGHLHQYQSYAPQPPNGNWGQIQETSFISQPAPADIFPPKVPPLSSDQNYLNAPPPPPPPPRPAWVDFPPYAKEVVIRPVPSLNYNPQYRHVDGSLGSEFISHPGTRFQQAFQPVERQKHINEAMQRPPHVGIQQNQAFAGQNLIEQHYLRPQMTDRHQLGSFQPLPPPNEGMPFPYTGNFIQPQDHPSFYASAGGTSYSGSLSHGPHHSTLRSNFYSSVGEIGNVGSSLQRPLSVPEHLSDIRLAKIVVPTHYNPFASTFEQSSTSSKYMPGTFGQDGSTNFGNKFVSSLGYDHRLMSGHGSTKLVTPPLGAGRTDLSFSAKSVDRPYPWRASMEDVENQFRRETPAGDQYDPLFDSIEPSSKVAKKLSIIHDQDPEVHDADIASSVLMPADVDGRNKHKIGPTISPKIENDEFGETAPDAEVGAVENESPVLVDGRDWSPVIPLDLPDKVTGDVEIDQVRSPGKSKKSKDSRSMKLFKIALADFVKEVLKPSWRQGNMSKEAFKTIVKKTVDRVSSSVSRHQIPRTQAKVNQYVESSQRKLTKLVMGYVDKYVKM